jgi:hypothetical protein
VLFGVIAQPPVLAIDPALPVVLAVMGFANVTTCDELIDIAFTPLVWITIAPEVSAVTFNAVAEVVPAFRVVAILGS